MPDSEPFSLSLDLSWSENDEGNFIVSGCASVPEPDSENEIITKEAIEAALPDFMNLAVLHLDHTERPVGMITESWFEGDKFMIRGPIKPTGDCKDVRNRIRTGNLGQFSILGRRISGTPSCRLNPVHRSEVCKTTALFLDSVSVCPKGNAINENSYLEHNGGGIVEKAMNSAESAMIHTTADGTEEIKNMDTNEPAPDNSGSDSPTLQQILDAITGMSDRIDALEQQYEELTSVEPEDVQKAGDEDDGEYDDAGDEGENELGVKEYLSIIGEALQMILSNQQEFLANRSGGEIEKAKDSAPGDAEPEDDGYEEDDGEEDLEKGCSSVKKAVTEPDPTDDLLKKALERLEAQEQELAVLRKSVVELNGKLKPRDVVIVPELVQKAKTGDSGDVNPVNLVSGMLGT